MSFLAPTTRRHQRQAAIAAAHEEVTLLPDHDGMVEAILDQVARASAHAESEGLRWYASAHALAADLGARHGTSTDTACSVIAALSPQTGWSENLRLADRALADGKASAHLGDCLAKADRIIGGELPADVLGGRKVRSFYRNIADPARPGPVTIDRHAVSVVVGRKVTDAEYKRVSGRIGLYVRISAAYRSAARLLNILPHECQAIAWCAWREEHDIAAKYDPEF